MKIHTQQDKDNKYINILLTDYSLLLLYVIIIIVELKMAKIKVYFRLF